MIDFTLRRDVLQRSVAAFTNLQRATKYDGELRFIVWRSAEDNPFMTTAERAAAPLLPNRPPRRADAPGQFAFADAGRVHAVLHERRLDRHRASSD
jgi:hypothetical protein